MEQNSTSAKIFITGFLIGLILSLIPYSRDLLHFVVGLFYANDINIVIFALFWALLFGGFLYANYAIYLKEKSLGLVKLWVIFGFMFLAMFMFISDGLDSVSGVFKF